MILRSLYFAAFSFAASLCLCAAEYNIIDYGAVPDGRTLSTLAIQKAVDACAGNGGGRVTIPAGTYYTGVIFMRSHVELHLEQNAILLGSTDYADYPEMIKERKGVIHCAGINDSSITGYGTIDARGDTSAFQLGDSHELRAHCVIFSRCKGMRIEGVTLRNAADWTFRILWSQQVFVHGIRIYSHSNFNNDGIDIDGQEVTVSDCLIEATDDGICFKSDHATDLCANITVTNCVIASNCNAIKFGTASKAGFRNITVSNCVIKTPAENDLFGYKSHIIPGVVAPMHNNSGIALEEVDAGLFEKVLINNISMENVLTPIFIRLGARRPREPQALQDVIISNIIANSVSHMSCSITGIPGYNVKGIRISNIILNCSGGGLEDAVHKPVPEHEKMYPENKMFGPSLPAYGFYLRHVENIILDGIELRLQYPDKRHAIFMEDAHNVCVNGLSAGPHHSPHALIRVVDCSNVTLSGYRSGAMISLFAKVSGAQSDQIKMIGNDFNKVGSIIETAPEVNKGVIINQFNLNKP